MSKKKTSTAVGSSERVRQHVELLKEILEHQIANLDNPHGDEFYRCYTYPSGDMPSWVKKAKRLVQPNAEFRNGGAGGAD